MSPVEQSVKALCFATASPKLVRKRDVGAQLTVVGGAVAVSVAALGLGGLDEDGHLEEGNAQKQAPPLHSF